MDTGVSVIWQELVKLMTERNPGVEPEELAADIELIRSNAKFVTGLIVSAQKFTISVGGQAIGFEMFYDPVLRCWKLSMKDAIESVILSDITLLAGVNAVEGLWLRYKGTNDEGEIVDDDLVIKGLFVTEPRGAKFDRYEQGIESSKYAFAKDDLGNSCCAILYFTDRQASDTYKRLINGEVGRELIDLNDLDYIVEVD